MICSFMTIKISVIRIIICIFDTQTVKVFESPAQHHHRTVLWNWAFWYGHYQEKLRGFTYVPIIWLTKEILKE